MPKMKIMRALLIIALLVFNKWEVNGQVKIALTKFSDCINYFMEEQNNSNLVYYQNPTKENNKDTVYKLVAKNVWTFNVKHYIELLITKYENGEFSKIDGYFFINAADWDKLIFKNTAYQNYFIDQKIMLFCSNFNLTQANIVRIKFRFYENETEGILDKMSFKYFNLESKNSYDKDCVMQQIDEKGFLSLQQIFNENLKY